MYRTELNNEPPDKWFIRLVAVFVLIILLVIGYRVFAQKTPQNPIVRPHNATPMISQTAFLSIEGFDSIMARLIECESNWNETAVGDHGKAYGLLQFWETTFELYKNKYDLPELQYKDPDDQITLASIMIRDGHEHNWTCWKYAKR